MRLVVWVLTATVAAWSGEVSRATACEIASGFVALRDLIPAEVGDCTEDPVPLPDFGDVRQRTTASHGRGGLLEWRQPEKVAAFTDGHRTWLIGPQGLQSRLNTERFAWEVLLQPPPARLAGPEGDVPLVLGYTAWDARGRFSLAHGVFGPALLRTIWTPPPTEVRPGAALRFWFARYPDGLRLHRWRSDVSKTYEELTPDGSLVVPDAPGVYVYEAEATWRREKYGGQGNYMFHVRVVPPSPGP